jgi:hypothetical protein
VDVPTEGGIDTVQFLEATEGLIKLFGTLAWSVVAVWIVIWPPTAVALTVRRG